MNALTQRHPPELFVFLVLNLAVMMWGFSGVFGKWVSVDASTLTFWRMIVAWLAMAAIYCVRHKDDMIGFRLDFFKKNVLCGLLLMLHWFCFFKAIQLSTVALGIVFHASFVFMVAALEPFLIKTKPKPLVIIAAIVGASGLIISLYSQIEAFGRDPMLWFYGFLTAACYAALSLFNRAFMQKDDVLDAMTGQFLWGALIILPFAYFASETLLTFNQTQLIKLLTLGILVTAIGHTIFFWSLRHITATKAGVLTLLEPVYAIFFAAAILREMPDGPLLVGTSIVVVCAAVVALVSTISTESKNKNDNRLDRN